MHRVTDSPSARAVLFSSTSTGVGVISPWEGKPLIEPNGQWVTFEIPDYLPDDTAGIELSGILRMGNAHPDKVTHQRIGFRAFGESEDYPIILQQRAGEQLLEGDGGKANDGDRLNAFVYVPVRDRKFDMKWEFIGYEIDSFPTTVTNFGFNFKLIGYTKYKN